MGRGRGVEEEVKEGIRVMDCFRAAVGRGSALGLAQILDRGSMAASNGPSCFRCGDRGLRARMIVVI